MLGSRSIWHEGWKAVTTHPTIAGWGHFNDDEWELYHTDVDRSELHNLAAEQPDKVRELVNIWFSEAGAQHRVPARRSIGGRDHEHASTAADRAAGSIRLLPGRRGVPEWQAVNTRGRSFVIGALVDIPAPGAEGVLFAFGSRFGGHALYVKDNRLHYVNSFVGSIEQKIDGSEDIPTGEEPDPVRVVREGRQEPDHATGILTLFHGEKKVGEGRIKTQLGAFEHRRVHLTVGRDPGEAITEDYPGRVAPRVHRRHDQPRRGRRQRRAVRRPRARGRAHDHARVTLIDERAC